MRHFAPRLYRDWAVKLERELKKLNDFKELGERGGQAKPQSPQADPSGSIKM